MPKPFDTTLKDLFTQNPSDLAPLLGIGAVPLRLLPTNLVANLDTDLVLGVGDPIRGVIDLNFQVRWDEETPYRLFCYNSLLHREHRVPIHSVVVLLKARENDLRLDHGIRYALFPERGRMEFALEVIRLWEQPLERMLTGGLGLLPLATLAAMPEGVSRADAMPEILRRIQERLARESTQEQGDQFRTWTCTLAGIHLTESEIREIVRRSQSMIDDILKESSFWTVLKELAECKALQEQIIRRGTRKFGGMDKEVEAHLAEIGDLPHLERMLDSTFTANSWDEVLAVP
jgi:hypothetical protein